VNEFPPQTDSHLKDGGLEMEDTELVQATRQGDLNAFNELVLKYQDQVFNLALRLLGNEDTAEDATQDTFILAFQKIYQFDGNAFRAWLLKIATNLCYDEMRKWRRHPQQSLEPIDKYGETNESPYWLKDSKPLPEDIFETSNLRNTLEHGLSQLPLNFRAVVTLVDIHQMNYKEASSAIGISIGTLKSRLSRGRLQLRNILLDTEKQNLPRCLNRSSDRTTVRSSP
jgi:RNA polymerase sigma-70 factor (ECF subfamily)